MTSPEMGTDTAEGEVVVVVLTEAPTKEHCHARIPANHHGEKAAEEEVEEVVEGEEDDGLSPQQQQQGEVLVVE